MWARVCACLLPAARNTNSQKLAYSADKWLYRVNVLGCIFLKISLFTCRHSLSQVGRGPSSFGSQLNMLRRLIFSSSSPKGTLTTRVPAGRTGLWRRNEQVNANRQLDFSAAAGGEEEYGKGVRGEGALARRIIRGRPAHQRWSRCTCPGGPDQQAWHKNKLHTDKLQLGLVDCC